MADDELPGQTAAEPVPGPGDGTCCKLLSGGTGEAQLSTWARGNYRKSLPDRIYRYKKCTYQNSRTWASLP